MRVIRAVLVLSLVLGCERLWQEEQPTGGGPGGGGPLEVDGGGGGGGGGAPIGGGGAGFSCGTGPEAGATVAGVTPRALSGGTLLALSSGGLVAGDPDRSRLWLISPDLSTVDAVPLADGDDPGRVIEGPAGKVYVTLRARAAVVELDVATHALRTLDTCALPRGLAWDDAHQRLVVACLDGAMERVDPATGAREVVPLRAALSDLRDVVVDGDHLLVSTFREAGLYSVAADGAVSTLSTPAVSFFEPHVGWRLSRGSDGVTRFIRQQHRITVIPTTTSCSAYGGFARDTRTSGGGTGFGTRNVVTSELLELRNGVVEQWRPLSDVFTGAVVLGVDVAVSSTGRVAVASAGTGTVTVLTPNLREDLFVTPHDVDTQLTSVAFVDDRLFVFVREPAQLRELSPNGTVLRTVLFPNAAPSRATGHELFHRGANANVACASCHPEAGDDGFVWHLAEGDFRTPSLRGGLGGTAPYHWVGDLPDIFALMSKVMALRMNGPTVDLDGAQAVEDWLHAQPALALPSLDAAQVARGATVFSQAGCDTCHTGAQGTNNATVDVGTGAAFQVPRLTEFARRAPWFHDGRMRTLADRFTAGSGGDLHGSVSGLSDAQKADLLEYLRSR